MIEAFWTGLFVYIVCCVDNKSSRGDVIVVKKIVSSSNFFHKYDELIISKTPLSSIHPPLHPSSFVKPPTHPRDELISGHWTAPYFAQS